MHQDHDPIALLGREHVLIMKVVGALARFAGSPDHAETAGPETLREVVRFMREFADRYHHAKEEDLLFPAMEDKGVPESGCPLGALRHEHQQGRALVARLAAATEALATEKPGAAHDIAETVQKIGELYSSHIWKEDEMVFPMVHRLMSEGEREALFQRFENAEKQIDADQEALAAFADDLSTRC